MGNDKVEKPPSTGETLSSDAAILGANIPVIGGFVSSFFKISSKGKAIILLIIFLLIVYPLICLFAALLIIGKSPSSVKNGARSFILSSIGVDDEMMERVNRSNMVIDALIPLQFSFGENDQTVQRVAADQKISFDAFMRKQHIDGGADCAVEQPIPDEPIGKLTVRSLASKADPYTADIDPKFGDLFAIGTLGPAQWDEIQKLSKSGKPEDQHPLKIKVTENPAIASSPFMKCNKITVDLYMTIFKPTMVRGSK
jgi:hypothetical protein